MSGDDDPAGKVDGVEYLELPSVRVARIGQVAVGVVTGERDQARGVGRGVSDSVDHLHVSDVVDVEGLLQTHHQALVIETGKMHDKEILYTGVTDLFILTALILSPYEYLHISLPFLK